MRTNTMDGSNRGKGKTILPSIVGKVRLTHPQADPGAKHRPNDQFANGFGRGRG